MTVDLRLGDCLEILPMLPDKSIALIVTSPPYGDMYFGLSIDKCRNLIATSIKELERALISGGKLVVNINNYVTSKRNGWEQRQVIPMTMWIQQCCSLIYQDEIFWYKNLASAGRGKPLFGSYPYPPNLLMAQRIEYVLVYTKPGKREVSTEQKELSKLTKEQWREWTQNLWHIQGIHDKEHPAPFPPELVDRLIRLYSFWGDTVIDPFMGSGTTGVACVKLNRNFIGIEIDPGYFEISKRRITEAQAQLALNMEAVK